VLFNQLADPNGIGRRIAEIIEKMQSMDSIRMTVMASLFAALIAAGAFLAIPVGPVPIYLANFFVMLAGLVLG